jgi:type I restriction enzyme S subunit
MNKWKIIKIGDICDQIRGVSYSPEDTSNIQKDGYVPIYRAHNIQKYGLNSEKMIFIKSAKIADKQYIKSGDIVICASSGSKNLVGKAAQASKNLSYSFGAFCKVVRPRNINATFIGFYFKSNIYRKIISNLSLGANINNLRNENIDSLLIPLPPENIQKQIVSLLCIVEDSLKFQNEQLKQLDLLIKSRFVEMFGDPEGNEKEWAIQPWGEVVTIKNGKDHKRVSNQGGGYPIYGSGGLMGYATEYLCNENAVVVGRKGTIDRPFVVREKFWNVDTAFGIEPKEGIDIEYLFQFCKMFDFGRLNRTVTLPSLTKGDLLQIQMQVPPLELQTCFSAFAEAADKLKFDVQQTIDKTQLLFDSLMNKYFG